MNHRHFLLLFGGFILFFSNGSLLDPCNVYISLTDPWRNIGFSSTSFNAYPMDDINLSGNWLRFHGIAGDVIPEFCVPLSHCGGLTSIYLGFPHPQVGLTSIGHSYCLWDDSCQYLISSNMQVKACSNGYYVYKLPVTDYRITFGVRHSNCSSTSCGPLAQCTSDGGCVCIPGYRIPEGFLPTGDSYGCQDIDECAENPEICYPNAYCSNTPGTYNCTSYQGYHVIPGDSNATLYEDVDECNLTTDLCGPNSICYNTLGSYDCFCQDAFYPSTGLYWEFGITACRSMQETIDSLTPSEGQSVEMFLLSSIWEGINNGTNSSLSDGFVRHVLTTVLSVMDRLETEEGEEASVVLKISEKLMSGLVENTQNLSIRTVKMPNLEITSISIGPERNKRELSTLTAMGNSMQIDLSAVAKSNNGSATAVLMSVGRLGKAMSTRFFATENVSQMYSDFIIATLPKTNLTRLPEAANFTIRHKKGQGSSLEGLLTCVYWEDNGVERRWSTEGCSTSISDDNHTVCSCTHLSTFALILQTGEAPVDDPMMQWINLICVSVGLTFLALSVLTFLLCSWNPKVNNTARLHLSLCLFLAQFLFLVGLSRTENKLVCAVIAGLLHFLFLSSFVWMFLETLQLFLLVRGLAKVQVIQREGLRSRYLLLIGYGIPMVVVGLSAGIVQDGYGNSKQCWLNKERNFTWSFLGPVCAILSLNTLLFCVILWILRPTLVNMKSDVSQAKDTKLIMFKILAQFVVLGCTWILGFFQSSTFLKYLFIVINSQQGTFIFIIHCLLNKEVREDYKRLFCCLCGVKELSESRQPCDHTLHDSVRAASSVSETVEKEFGATEKTPQH